MKAPVASPNPCEGTEKKSIKPELWQACAGPLVNLPPAGTHVIYFPQGHIEQVAASMKKDVYAQMSNYPNLPSKLLCLLQSVSLHADPETDEVYAQMTLQPVQTVDKEALLRSDFALKTNKPQPEFFCKTLATTDTSIHVPRRAAEKIFPPLDFSMQSPAQELVARDLHDKVWIFHHICLGQPKCHFLTAGWSLFVIRKKLVDDDSILFIRDEKQHLRLGIRRANRQPTNLSSSALSSDSMHIETLAAAAHAAANNRPFTVFYNPRYSPSEFVIPLAKYYKAVCRNQISLGMHFQMMFEIEKSRTTSFMGTITGISDLDPARWKNSQWRNLQVGWCDKSRERHNRVSIWEIEPVPFLICSRPFFRPKRPRQASMPDVGIVMKGNQGSPDLSLAQWLNMPHNPALTCSTQPNYMQNLPGADIFQQLGLSAPQTNQANNLQFGSQRLPQQAQQHDQLPNLPSPINSPGSVMQTQPQQQMSDVVVNQTCSGSPTPVPEPSPCQPQKYQTYFGSPNQPSTVLPSVGAFTVQCAACFKWRLIPTKEKYEEFREHILEQPFFCETAREWRPDISCDDPADVNQDGSMLWVIDKPNIAQSPPGWQRLLQIRGEGSAKFAADVYYVAPSGKKLCSMVDIQKYLLEHSEHTRDGVTLSRFSFQIPMLL
ncbi:auxin response factor 19-like [Humulus lupulus]|uniref:auxin response factor 19-like n=1 Tax=Humulus lupulus TaxID=3486 RepID=UPI002B410B8B|nr:auxin response factor 19-like [Humulus lupulus]